MDRPAPDLDGLAAIVAVDALADGLPISWVSPGFELLTGYGASEVLGRNAKLLQGPDTDPRSISVLTEAIAAGRDAYVTLLNYRADGTPFWNEVAIAPERDGDGQARPLAGHAARRHRPHAPERAAARARLLRRAHRPGQPLGAARRAALRDASRARARDRAGAAAGRRRRLPPRQREVGPPGRRRAAARRRRPPALGRPAPGPAGPPGRRRVRAAAQGPAERRGRARRQGAGRAPPGRRARRAARRRRPAPGDPREPRHRALPPGHDDDLRRSAAGRRRRRRVRQGRGQGHRPRPPRDLRRRGPGPRRRLRPRRGRRRAGPRAGRRRRSPRVYQPIVDLASGETLGYEALARGPEGSPLHRPDRLFAAAAAAGRVVELDWACRIVAVRGALEAGLGPHVIVVPQLRAGRDRHAVSGRARRRCGSARSASSTSSWRSPSAP